MIEKIAGRGRKAFWKKVFLPLPVPSPSFQKLWQKGREK
jgi:hypothetical protein